MSRREDFRRIQESFMGKDTQKSENCVVVNDDALVALKSIPSKTVSLILTDPPYHSTKKNNIVNDCSFSSDQDFIDWIEEFAKEWKRILRPNGSIFMFCSSSMEAKLEVMLSNYFNVLSHIVWTKPNEPGFDGWKGKMKKESLRQWYPHSERIIFMEAAAEGNLKRSNFGMFLKAARKECNLSGHELTEKIGAYGKVNHGGAVSNWESGRNIPNKEQYAKISQVLLECGYREEIPEYDDIIRRFEVSSNVEFTDIWTFPSVRPYKGKHPAEKPLDMLEHCISSTTVQGDIVLDCFAGSGSTLIASLKTKRLAIGIEIDREWYRRICDRILRLNPNEDNDGITEISMKKLSSPTVTVGSLFEDLD